MRIRRLLCLLSLSLSLLGFEAISVSSAFAATQTVEQKKAAAIAQAKKRLAAKQKATSTKVTKTTAKKTTTQKVVKKTTAKPVAKKTTAKATPKVQKAAATKEKANLESQKKDIKNTLSSIKKDIAQKQSRAKSAEEELKESEKAISKSNRSLKELSEKKTAATARLADLKTEAKIVGLQVGEAEDVVTSIAQAQFLNSMRHPWQTAIEGGNPNEVSRRSAVLGYLAQEQTRTINRLENRQKNIEAVAKKTEETRKELVRIESEEQKNRASLEKEKSSRSVALNRLRGEIKTQQDRYEQLVKNDRELSSLIAKIDRQIEAAEKQERLEAEKRRLAAEKSRTTPAKRTPQKTTPKVDTSRLAIAPVQGNFGALKGKLTVPVKGTIAATYGQRREGAASSLPWRGLLIRAKAGESVHATAPGTVVFSDWMRGFGNLLILDHGSNYLSVYANNESLFKSVGDTVAQGETIASVGNSGGEESPGLYFELRYKGKPFDPAKWLTH